MTEKEIRKYINLLNKGVAEELIFLRQINHFVEVAKVWTKEPKITDNISGNFCSYRFFFIKNELKEYVGAVFDMYDDLHWYIVPKFRKKGYLSRALKEAILPYIYEERETQKISIDRYAIGMVNYINSKKVALKLGFKELNETKFELERENFNWEYENIEEIDSVIDSERYEILRKRAYFAYKILYKISDELLIKINDDKDLKKIADEVGKYTWKIEDLEWDNNKLQ